MDYDWLHELKVGDQVIMCSSEWVDEYFVTYVAKITKKLIITPIGNFTKEDGRESESNSHDKIIKPTPYLLDFINRINIAKKIKHKDLMRLSLEQLTRIYEIVNENKED